MTPEEHNKRLSDFLNAKANLKQNQQLAAQNESSEKQTESMLRQERETARQTESMLRQERALKEERDAQQQQERNQAELFNIKTRYEQAEADLPLPDPRPFAEELIDRRFANLLNPNLYSSMEWKQVAVDTSNLIDRFKTSFNTYHMGVIEAIEQERAATIAENFKKLSESRLAWVDSKVEETRAEEEARRNHHDGTAAARGSSTQGPNQFPPRVTRKDEERWDAFLERYKIFEIAVAVFFIVIFLVMNRCN